MKKYYLNLLFGFIMIGIVIISSITLNVLLKLEKNTTNNTKVEQMKSEKFVFELYMKQLIQESIISNCNFINNNSIELLNQSQINEPTLVYRYSALGCNECIEYGNKKLEAYFKNYKNNKSILFVISDYVPKFNNEIQYTNYLDLQKNKLDIPIEDSNIPFYCILYNNCVSHIFIPDKNYPEYTDLYLQEIKRRFFPGE